MGKVVPASAAAPRGQTSARPQAVGEAVAVALQHLHVGQQVVGQQHRLGALGVGVAGQDGVGVALGQVDQGLLELLERRGRSAAQSRLV